MISVVIPLYNKAHTIVNTLNTVFAQTYQDFEVIIVNDGSTDNGVEVIQRNFDDPRIKIIQQKNAGVSAARNRGVDESKGKYIAFLDGDDEWHPDYLSIINDTISKYPQAGMICTGGLIGNKKDPNKIGYRIAKKYLGQITPINFFENPCVFAHTSGLIIRKDIFNKTHGFPIGMKCCEDYACSQAVALITQTIYIGLPISKYNGGVEGQTTSIDTETRFKYLKYVVDYYNLVMTDFITWHSTNKIFKVFFKYDIRHRIKEYMKRKDYRSLNYFIDNLSTTNTNLFMPWEMIFYRKKIRFITILWINFTKVIWRLNKYPIVGEKINPHLIETEYRKW